MDLYALPPEDFTAARDAVAKAARDEGDKGSAKELAALRRPTVSAHVVNLLVRAEPDLLAQLLDLGTSLKEAQEQGQGDALRALGDQRRQLVESVVDRALEVAEREATAAVRAEVASTLEAALADPASAEAVRSGRLVRALSFAGFGGVDLEGAVAVVPARARPVDKKKGKKAPERDTQAVARAEQRAQDAHGELDDAVRTQEAARRDADAAQAAVADAAEALEAAQAAVTAAREQLQEREEEARRAAREATRKAKVVASAQAAAEKAREALDALRRKG